jgi:hypothetical protein
MSGSPAITVGDANRPQIQGNTWVWGLSYYQSLFFEYRPLNN